MSIIVQVLNLQFILKLTFHANTLVVSIEMKGRKPNEKTLGNIVKTEIIHAHAKFGNYFNDIFVQLEVTKETNKRPKKHYKRQPTTSR